MSVSGGTGQRHRCSALTGYHGCDQHGQGPARGTRLSELALDISECLGHLESYDNGEAGVAAEGENALNLNLIIVEAYVRLVRALERGCPLEGMNLLEWLQ